MPVALDAALTSFKHFNREENEHAARNASPRAAAWSDHADRDRRRRIRPNAIARSECTRSTTGGNGSVDEPHVTECRHDDYDRK